MSYLWALLGRLSSGRLVRATAAISGATAVGQLLGVLLLPVLTRMYGPDALGVYSILFSATLILTPIATLRLDAAVPLVVDAASVRAIQAATVRIMAVVCLAILVCIWGLRPWFSSTTDAAIYPSVYLLPAMVFLSGLYVVQTQSLIRVNAYSNVAKRNLTNSAAMLGTQVGLGAVQPSPVSLTIGFLVGRIVSVLQMSVALRSRLASDSRARIRPILHRYRGFLANLTTSSFLQALGGNAPLLLMGIWYGSESAGYVGVAQRILMVPAALIGTSLSQVMLGEFANYKRDAKAIPTALVGSMLKRLAPIALLLIIGPLVAGPKLAEIVLGPEWVAAGEFAQLLGFVAAGSLLASPMANLLVVLERSRAILIIESLRLGLTVGFGVLAHEFTDSQYLTLAAMVLALVVVYTAFVIVAWRALATQAEDS